jgi:hypothetical protein
MAKQLTTLRPRPHVVAPIHAVRGSLLLAGRKVLRDRRLYPRYEALVPAEDAAALAQVTSSDWVPAALVEVHERAFDGLELSRGDARAVGAEMSRALNGVVYSTLVRLAGQLGASPWVVLDQADKTWRRLYAGGAIRVHRLGNADARVEVLGDPFTPYALHREAFGGALLHVLEVYCERPSLTELFDRRGPMSFSFVLRWAPAAR